MKLSFDQIKSITTGAVRLQCDESGVSFYRFTQEQTERYKERNETFYRNNFSTAGIKLRFRTDSKNLSIGITTEPGTSRRYFSLDVSVNGSLIGSIDNFVGREIPKNFHAMSGELGDFSGSFSLGEGIKDICISLPWSVITKICYIELDDGSFTEPIKHSKKLLAFGDSITQGYDALRPSSRYVAKLCEALDAEEFNKAIGGERFWGGLSEMKDDIDPDIITVAYGTNDWSRSKVLEFANFECFVKNCESFFSNLRKNYPDKKIFAITPIWREDKDVLEADWKFDDTRDIISRIVEPYDINVIDGENLVPHDVNFFGDLRLHPNDNGFEHYFENLYNIIKTKI